jgi:hypothetical protein
MIVQSSNNYYPLPHSIMAGFSKVLYMGLALFGMWNGKVCGEVIAGQDLSPSLRDILKQAHKGPLYTYPTSLTQGIVPVS